MGFRGRISDYFPLKAQDGLALMLTHVQGRPAIGMALSLAGRRVSILDVGQNSADGLPVSTRACLTGKSVAAYGGIFVDWAPPYPKNTLHKIWVEEVEIE